MLSLQRRLFAGYRNKEKLPLGGYALLDATYAAWLLSSLRWLKRSGKGLPDSVNFKDLALLGIATHKLSIILTKEWSTAPLRAAFTQYQGIEQAGELNERSRGQGLQEAIGDLLTCPYCTGVWVATAFTLGMVASSRTTRLIASIFGAVAVSDFLHSAYEKV
jgi:hypothetical protein